MTAANRQMLSVEDIKDLLHARRADVAYHYAPTAQGSYEDKGGYWTLNPGRPDRSVGSFVVWIDGPRAGRWNDYATGQRGDLLDLIALNLGSDLKTAFREARSFLGLQSDSPEDVARRKAAAERARARRADAERAARVERAKAQKRAFALWLSGQERIKGTPVEAYLRTARAINLDRLGHQPAALRYHPEVYYNQTDPDTGEVFEGRGPAMLALATDLRGNPVSCHRTWLTIGPDGRWSKAPLPKPKMVLGDYKGAAIRIWRGLGPRGGKGKTLAEVEPGARVYLTEGIEDAMSVADLLPQARVMAAISISNFGNVDLPPAVTEVVLVADQDFGAQAKEALDRAVQQHARAGRTVRVWKNLHGGKDINDALQTARRQTEGAEDADAGSDDGSVASD
ncbi:MAG: toprim domain-containing protein [Paracoccaceae bacterium]|nr:toprim domain-containing protein [Paracoccaceae bacterium]